MFNFEEAKDNAENIEDHDDSATEISVSEKIRIFQEAIHSSTLIKPAGFIERKVYPVKTNFISPEQTLPQTLQSSQDKGDAEVGSDPDSFQPSVSSTEDESSLSSEGEDFASIPTLPSVKQLAIKFQPKKFPQPMPRNSLTKVND